jgi:ribosomal protein S20
MKNYIDYIFLAILCAIIVVSFWRDWSRRSKAKFQEQENKELHKINKRLREDVNEFIKELDEALKIGNTDKLETLSKQFSSKIGHNNSRILLKTNNGKTQLKPSEIVIIWIEEKLNTVV